MPAGLVPDTGRVRTRASKATVAAASAGIAAGAATLGSAEVLAAVLTRTGLSDGVPSPLVAVAGSFVDLTPLWLKNLAVAIFGTADKIALFVGMAIVLGVGCGLIGILVRSSRTFGLALWSAIAVVGLVAVLTRAGSGTLDALPTILGAVVGLSVLTRLLPVSDATVYASGQGSQPIERPGTHGRRQVLHQSVGVSVVGLLAIAGARAVSGTRDAVRAAREALRIPPVAQPITVPASASQAITGQTPFVTPTDDFYRIDTALVVPQVDPSTWRLRVHGLVEREVELDLAELLEQTLIESLVTLTCVSNEVGGDLAGNAVWTGWPVRELLARAGPQPDADMVLSTSVDGWTAGTPLETLTDERNALLAVAMNGEPLPSRHGFPVRLVVPGLYGYVSATKWVVDLKVTRFSDDVGYWTPRGWSARGPIKTASRIDVPGSDIKVGPTVIAGVAWAQHRGISRVEVQVDDAAWQEAILADEPTVDAWRQWRLPWAATVGTHTITVRAVDGEGVMQTEERARPDPNGATGWHSIAVRVAG